MSNGSGINPETKLMEVLSAFALILSEPLQHMGPAQPWMYDDA